MGASPTEAGEKPGGSAQRRADASTLAGRGNIIDVGMRLADVLVGDDADLRRWHARRFKRAEVVLAIRVDSLPRRRGASSGHAWYVQK